MNSHPLQRFERQYWIWWLLGISFTLLSVVLFLIPLDPGMLAYEFDALGVIARWDFSERLWAAFSLGLDFLYLVVYSTLLALGCLCIANKLQGNLLAKLGIPLAWGQWLAASFDIVENILLLAILLNSQSQVFALAAMLCAILKFALIIAGLLYIVIGKILGA